MDDGQESDPEVMDNYDKDNDEVANGTTPGSRSQNKSQRSTRGLKGAINVVKA
jgi:hypothetical protein